MRPVPGAVVGHRGWQVVGVRTSHAPVRWTPDRSRALFSGARLEVLPEWC